jgi:glycosyltransferase involved in cell wall biosynthesis
LKILQISSARSFGGGERHVTDLINSLVDRGHVVYAAVRPKSPLLGKLDRLPKQNVRLVPLRNALDVLSARELARFVRQAGAEIIHAHMARDYPLAAFAARSQPEAKLILTRHVLFPLNRFQSRVMGRAAGVIAVSEAVAVRLRAQNLIPPGRIIVVSNGVEVDRFNEAVRATDRALFYRSWGFPENSLVVGTVGELNELKGHDVFLQAAAQVISVYPQARFLIVGGDFSPGAVTLNALKQMVRELNLVDHVRLLGQVEEVAPLLAVMDVFVSASQTESFGLAIVEALASSLPVVATETEGAREIISPGATGFLIPLGQTAALAEAVNRLLGDRDLRRRMGQSAYRDASERFQLEKMIDAIERIYEESIKQRRAEKFHS